MVSKFSIPLLLALAISFFFACEQGRQAPPTNLSDGMQAELQLDTAETRPVAINVYNNLNIPEDSIFRSLENEDDSTLTTVLISINQAGSIQSSFDGDTRLYVRREGKALEIIENYKNIQQMPSDVLSAYQIITQDERIVAVGEMNGGPGQDHFNAYYHYFDENGETQAFIRYSNFRQSSCTDGIAYETSEYFFDPEFRVIAKNYQLLDEQNNPLAEQSCSFPVREPYLVYESLDECMAQTKLSEAINQDS